MPSMMGVVIPPQLLLPLLRLHDGRASEPNVHAILTLLLPRMSPISAIIT
ncbi:hypothetical protein SCP_0311430 [Sparassis crispa]|uniref:Uncharacterized protein n=1 Tax=Sparassis crispa TaxID=139825 RepID=A0A401GGT8_9APHY|nr:hypothetical protein SCP_0311430 [Sparassis crispa]GBE81414.1 hypothetical protein SCP_0311430 [Sparassis crispa]